ncbi:unnamed protein product [Mytilus coruscus]|uniref:Uncharacterized protein n=1 Tax=Mytilus coruscus TaxID=42192 RepID=A0A6J8E238_MYTCO|nr:unnamed protein product [Mytilus coruscus]
MDNLTVSLKLVPPDAKKRRVEVGVDKCIICDSVVDEILITSTESGRKSLINAAAKRHDDLFSYLNEFCNETASELPYLEPDNLLNNAVYHAACLTTYLTYRPKSTDKSAYDLAFERVVEIIDRDLIRDKKSLVLSSLLTMYQSFLPDKISKTYCNTSKLKAKLEKHYRDAIVIFAQQGQDPIVQTPDILWVIRRMICREGSILPHELFSNCTEQLVPFWSGFFSTLADFKPDRAIVAYGPIIDNKPSDMATVFTAMHNCQNLATMLEDRLADVPKHLWSRMKEANFLFESPACSGNSQPVDNLTEIFTQYVTPVLTEYMDSASEKSPTFKYWLMLLHAI